jgi:hypothetical protein
LSSIHTTWDWHYCGGILQSVSLANENRTCCCGDKHKAETDSPDISQISKSCCSNYLIDIETDSFDLPGFVSGTFQQISHLFFLHHNPLKLSEPDKFSLIQHIFPPGNFAGYNTDLLALNCILRI